MCQNPGVASAHEYRKANDLASAMSSGASAISSGASCSTQKKKKRGQNAAAQMGQDNNEISPNW